MKRAVFECRSPPKRKYYDPDGTLEITSGDHGLTVEVTDDAACNSYNIEVCAQALVSRADAERLRDWLIEVLK